MKGQIKVGDQLIGVNDDYFLYFLTRDLVQCIKNKQSNPVRILTFQRYKKDEIWEFVGVIPKSEELSCHGKNCSKDAVVSWASNTTNHIRNFCEGCQVVEFGGWPKGVGGGVTAAAANASSLASSSTSAAADPDIPPGTSVTASS